jgi:hypothetical protein
MKCPTCEKEMAIIMDLCGKKSGICSNKVCYFYGELRGV